MPNIKKDTTSAIITVNKVKKSRANDRYSGTYTTATGNLVHFTMYYHREKKVVKFIPRLVYSVLEDLVRDEIMELYVLPGE
jgi:hypothetical protein